MVDNATDEDGKEFYTITTADESVFYLVIDKQKTSENVYFLNTVTTDDLLPLAEQGGHVSPIAFTVIIFIILPMLFQLVSPQKPGMQPVSKFA